MPLLRSLARGLDTGMDSYVRQRLLNRERQDKQDIIDTEQKRYETQQQLAAEKRAEERLTQQLQLAISANDASAIENIMGQMGEIGMLPPAPGPITVPGLPLSPTRGAQVGLPTPELRPSLSQFPTDYSREIIRDATKPTVDLLHPLTRGLVNQAQINEQNQELTNRSNVISVEQQQIELDEAINRTGSGEVKVFAGVPYVVYPPTEAGGQERIEPVSEELLAIFKQNNPSSKRIFVNTTTGAMVSVDSVTGKATTTIIPEVVKAKANDREAGLEDYRAKQDIYDELVTGRQQKRHTDRLEFAGIQNAVELTTKLPAQIMKGELTAADAIAVINASAAAFGKHQVSSASREALLAMVNDFTRLPLRFSATENNKLAGAYYIQTASNRLINLLKKPEVRDYVGRIDGSIQSVENFLTGEATANADLVEFDALLQDLKKGIIYARSGAQVSFEEFASYDRMLGTNFKDPNALKIRIMEAAKKSQIDREAIYRIELDRLYRGDVEKIAADWSRVPTLWSTAAPQQIIVEEEGGDDRDEWSTTNEELIEDDPNQFIGPIQIIEDEEDG